MVRAGLGRRRFLAGVAATACVGCTGGGAEGGASTTTALPLGGSFGGPVNLGKLTVVLDGIDTGRGFLYVPDGRFYITRFPADAVDAAAAVYDESLLDGIRAGVISSYQRCPHLGCRVPSCLTSGWFECPCHSSRFTGIGELVDGVSPRGMDHFPITIEDGAVVVDTSVPVEGVPIGTETVPHDAAGPHCVDG